MRLGQIKHILKTVSNDNHHLDLEAEPIANGGFYKISNLKSVKFAVDTLVENKLVDAPAENVESAFGNVSYVGGDNVVASQDYNLMRTYLASINTKLASVIDILDSLVPDQPEDVINVMLPSDACTFEDFEAVKTRIVNVFRAFMISEGDIEIVGFDSGSKWYKIRVKNKANLVMTLFSAISLTYQLLDYYNNLNNDPTISVQVETMNMVINEGGGDSKCVITQDGYIKKLIENKALELAKEYVGNLTKKQRDNNSEAAYLNMVKNGIVKMFNERKAGLVIDPSLNPPEILKGDEKMRYTIDYEKIHELASSKGDSVKELCASRDEEKN